MTEVTSTWRRCTPNFVSTLPVLDFPFDTSPDIFLGHNTVLRLADGSLFHAFQWCYLNRQGEGRGIIKSFEVESLSMRRTGAMPVALKRLSQWFTFNNARARSVERSLQNLGLLLSWADRSQNERRFEDILSDPDVALAALKGYHTYVRSLLQSHQISSRTAAQRDQGATACLSTIHDRVYSNYIESLQRTYGTGTDAPSTQAVADFSSMLQAIFDSAAAMVLSSGSSDEKRILKVSATDDSKIVELRSNYGRLRVMELACMAYAGLSFADSGANLSVLREYEEPDNLAEQLSQPDRINLTEKAVKFRAGGKEVEVHLSATTMSRLKTYMQVRQQLVESVGGTDIPPLFIQCRYENFRGDPVGVCALDGNFLLYLRRKIERAGATLPKVTLRELRAYKQQKLVRNAPVAVAAKLMGHSVKTAVTAYCKVQELTRRGELTAFLGSLHKTVVASPNKNNDQHRKSIPTGGCNDYGNPLPQESSAVVTPNCNKFEGCFFCDNYRLHADEDDMRKLLSCRKVLKYIIPLNGDSIRAERVYKAVVDRIDALLTELKLRKPLAYESAHIDVEVRGQLTRYWAGKLQQLHLLGMLSASPS